MIPFCFTLLIAAVPTSTSAGVAPDRAGGVRIAGEDDADPGRTLARGLLFVPRMITTVVFAPARGALWLIERYEIPEHLIGFFYNDERTFGVHPTLFAESSFGVGAGGRMIWRDWGAEGTRLSLDAGFGGRYKQRYRAELRTGDLIADWFELGMRGSYEDRPRDLFFGVGADSSDEEVRLQRRVAEGRAFATFAPADFMRLTLTGLYASSATDQSHDDPDAQIAPFRPNLDLVYQELFLELDTRRPATKFESANSPATGVYLAGALGLTEVLGGPTYWRWSADGQWLIDLLYGDRVLLLRGYVESVTGSLSEVPFEELPRLGGPELLRGYDRDRFLDRALLLVSAEYRFPISEHSLAYLFVDGGRVFRTLEEFSFADWGLGFGGGIELYTRATDLFRVQLAGSRNGDFIASLVVDTDFRHEPRSVR